MCLGLPLLLPATTATAAVWQVLAFLGEESAAVVRKEEDPLHEESTLGFEFQLPTLC